jgi:hypothetical protein
MHQMYQLKYCPICTDEFEDVVNQVNTVKIIEFIFSNRLWKSKQNFTTKKKIIY